MCFMIVLIIFTLYTYIIGEIMLYKVFVFERGVDYESRLPVSPFDRAIIEQNPK